MGWGNEVDQSSGVEIIVVVLAELVEAKSGRVEVKLRSARRLQQAQPTLCAQIRNLKPLKCCFRCRPHPLHTARRQAH